MTTVLVVDDQQEIRDSIADYFDHQGYDVRTAANGAEAHRLFMAGELPDVVLLDLIMPVMSGDMLYVAMQKDPRLAEIPVIVLTSDPSRAPRGLNVMKKPTNLNRLLQAVRQLGLN
jgi:CheY-like chemotaxis protein